MKELHGPEARSAEPYPYLCTQCKTKFSADWPSCRSFEVKLGTFKELKGRVNCNLCSLICTMDTITSGSNGSPIPVKNSQIITIEWNAGKKEFKVSPNGSFGTRIRLIEDNTHSQQFETASTTRNAHIDPQLMKGWLRECELNHGEKCDVISNKAPEVDEQKLLFSLRLIDVDSMCLVEGFTSWRYLTLSYCWGVVDEWRLLLKKSNKDSLLEKNSLVNPDPSIPLTISDAIHFTRSIGERYLWVDSLCLVQDDRKELANSIHLMGHIYERSALTIIAGSGASAHTGIPGVDNVARKSEIRNTKIGDRAFLMVVKHVDDCLRWSEYSRRAWTFQEELLSRRLVIFINDQVYFRCRGGSWNETTSLPGKSPQHHDRVLDDTLFVFDEHSSYFESFVTLILNYQRRTTTFESDVLRAVSGLLERLSARFDVQFLEGMPLPIERSLLFGTKGLSVPGRNDMVRRRNSFPSWSWAGWHAVYSWHDAQRTYDTSLSRWIVWYCCDGMSVKSISSLETQETASLDEQRSILGSKCFPNISASELPTSIRTPPYPGEIESKTNHNYRVLQFWTVSITLRLEKVTKEAQEQMRSNLNYAIKDTKGKSCGFLRTDYAQLPAIIPSVELILISECTYPAKFVTRNKMIDLPKLRGYWVMLIIWLGNIAERRGIGRISDAALDHAQRVLWKQITLG